MGIKCLFQAVDWSEMWSRPGSGDLHYFSRPLQACINIISSLTLHMRNWGENYLYSKIHIKQHPLSTKHLSVFKAKILYFKRISRYKTAPSLPEIRPKFPWNKGTMLQKILKLNFIRGKLIMSIHHAINTPIHNTHQQSTIFKESSAI